MPNDSSTGGFLSSLTSPLEDDALDAVFQVLIVGITGLPGSMVRPRWQPVVPKQPEPSIDWCAFGIVDVTPDDNAVNDIAFTGQYERHEDIELLVTFYGPNRNGFAQLLRDGLAVAQNREALKINLINFVSSAKMRSVPELVNLQWIRRSDLPLYFRRKIERTFGVLPIVGVVGSFEADASQGIITRDISA